MGQLALHAYLPNLPWEVSITQVGGLALDFLSGAVGIVKQRGNQRGACFLGFGVGYSFFFFDRGFLMLFCCVVLCVGRSFGLFVSSARCSLALGLVLTLILVLAPQTDETG